VCRVCCFVLKSRRKLHDLQNGVFEMNVVSGWIELKKVFGWADLTGLLEVGVE